MLCIITQQNKNDTGIRYFSDTQLHKEYFKM